MKETILETIESLKAEYIETIKNDDYFAECYDIEAIIQQFNDVIQYIKEVKE